MVLAARWKGKPFAMVYSGGHVGTSSEQTVMESTGIGAFMRKLFRLGYQCAADRGFPVRNWSCPLSLLVALFVFRM